MADHLSNEGWVVEARNWRGAGGEIDLIVSRDGAVRFVEVKQRADDALVGLEAVTRSKQRTLRRAAEAWLARLEDAPHESAFMVVLVGEGEDPSMELVDDAF